MRTIILIDNGHGKDTPGKGSPDALKGLTDSSLWFREYKWCREIAQACCDVLQAQGYDARLLVPGEEDVPLAERVRRVNTLCNKVGKENVILISIHNNAAGDGRNWMNARGWSAYTTKGVSKSDYLAEELYKEAKKEFRSPLSIRMKADKYLERDLEENFYILQHSLCPAVLIENFFQDNKKDVEYLKSFKGKGSCIHVITQGVENYIKLCYK